MNKSKAKALSLKLLPEVVPDWYLSNIKITFRLLTTNSYLDFCKIKTFLTAALEHLTPPEDEKPRKIKHVLVEIDDKGVKDNQQYITINIYLVIGGTTWKFIHSCKVRLKNPSERLD